MFGKEEKANNGYIWSPCCDAWRRHFISNKKKL
jgi:hypothetical protein